MKIEHVKIRTLPEIALDVHMTATGAMERTYGTGDAEQDRDIQELRDRLKAWEPTTFPRSKRFDAAVREMIVAALEEVGAAGDGSATAG